MSDFTKNIFGARPCVVGALQYLKVLGIGDFRPGIAKEENEGYPSPPCLRLDYPGFWRFRWGIFPGQQSISIWTKQVSNVSGYRPQIVVKANPEFGVLSDQTATAPEGTGWVQIGPLTLTASQAGWVWVELWNRDTYTFNSPCYFDHLVSSK